MKVKIKKDEKEEEIEIKLKGRDVKEIWKKFLDAQEAAQKEDGSKLISYFDFRDKLIAEKTGMKLDELDNLDIEEKQKLTKAVEEKVKNELSFMMPS